MEMSEKINESGRKKRKITLKGYYRELPKSYSPKTELLRKIMEECDVTYVTARNWAVYGVKPKDYEHVKVLSRLTNIPEDELFDEQ